MKEKERFQGRMKQKHPSIILFPQYVIEMASSLKSFSMLCTYADRYWEAIAPSLHLDKLSRTSCCSEKPFKPLKHTF